MGQCQPTSQTAASSWCVEMVQNEPDQLNLPLDNKDFHKECFQWMQTSMCQCSSDPVRKASSSHELSTQTVQDAFMPVRIDRAKSAEVSSGQPTLVMACREVSARKQATRVASAYAPAVSSHEGYGSASREPMEKDTFEDSQQYEWKRFMAADVESAWLRARDPVAREMSAMRAADVESWCIREMETCMEKGQRNSGNASEREELEHVSDNVDLDPSVSSKQDLGRVLLEAFLTCRQQEIDGMLETRQLPVHAHEREVEASRRFLEDTNQLKPHLVQRYKDPLARWLHDQVEKAPGHIARETQYVHGDLNEILETFS